MSPKPRIRFAARLFALTWAAIAPAVVIVHGTSGVDAKAALYAQGLNAAGIATLEIDLWSPRGLAGGWDGRPKHVKETLSMLAADRRYAGELSPGGQRFAAHAPFYPICFAYNRIPGYPFNDLTGAPIYILMERLRDSPLICEPYFEIVQIVPAVEDGYVAFEKANRG